LLQVTCLLPIFSLALARPQHPQGSDSKSSPHDAQSQPFNQVQDLSPKPYAYQYGIDDAETNASYQKSETGVNVLSLAKPNVPKPIFQDQRGSVLGSYVVALPDGRIQTTRYTSDPIQGFVAEVHISTDIATQ
jgi:hypothetical protein